MHFYIGPQKSVDKYHTVGGAILYLPRNPYEVCASKNRRDPKRDRFLGWVMSGNRGLRVALTLQESYPDRFLIVRYEDIVTKPVETFRTIFDFAGVPFQARYLDDPYVNRLGAHQTRMSETRGLSPSRVYYYTGILSPAKTVVLDMLVRKEKVLEYYPDTPHWKEKPRLSTRINALGLLAASPFSDAVRQVSLFFRHDPAWCLRRLLRTDGRSITPPPTHGERQCRRIFGRTGKPVERPARAGAKAHRLPTPHMPTRHGQRIIAELLFDPRGRLVTERGVHRMRWPEHPPAYVSPHELA